MSTVYLNGQMLPLSEAQISVLDRGFLFGDGVYEVIPVYNRRPLRLAQHLSRLNDSLNGIHLDLSIDAAGWGEIIQKVIDANQGDEQSVYLQVTRGAAEAREHAFPNKVSPTVFVMSSPIADIPAADDIRGASAVTLEDVRWSLCNLKTVALLGNVLLKQEALTRGYDEAVLVRDDYATECSASNLFMVKEGRLLTPPKSRHLLPGITRDLVVEVAREHGFEVIERDIHEAELSEADELWFTSSTKAIVPIVALNDRAVGSGEPGALWREVLSYYRDYVEKLKRGEAS
ncbi:D-alanine aminotransferase [gamma proteobacterium HTCC5015]|nr:D-alanine aminotransferase [gamma proteobacterium HTCC5015]